MTWPQSPTPSKLRTEPLSKRCCRNWTLGPVLRAAPRSKARSLPKYRYLPTTHAPLQSASFGVNQQIYRVRYLFPRDRLTDPILSVRSSSRLTFLLEAPRACIAQTHRLGATRRGSFMSYVSTHARYSR